MPINYDTYVSLNCMPNNWANFASYLPKPDCIPPINLLSTLPRARAELVCVWLQEVTRHKQKGKRHTCSMKMTCFAGLLLCMIMEYTFIRPWLQEVTRHEQKGKRHTCSMKMTCFAGLLLCMIMEYTLIRPWLQEVTRHEQKGKRHTCSMKMTCFTGLLLCMYTHLFDLIVLSNFPQLLKSYNWEAD